MDAALREAAAVGPFFALCPEGRPFDQGRLPLAHVYSAPEGPLVARIDAVAAALRTGDRRVAASIAFQGLAARLWSVALGAAVLGERLPDLGPERLRWNPARTAPDDLWLPTPRQAARDDGDLPAALRSAVLHGHLLPLHRATIAVCSVSSRVLWGNAASALVGSLRVLHGWCRTAGRPRAADRALSLCRSVLDDPLMRETGTLHEDAGAPAFVRRGCCLYYRVPGGGLCGDCVLAHCR
ncbi:(2Fe-2S)-binding protein [Wenjunlia tyrosinilytica]|uniref:(2Fe-2S)-binding protein n=1 Tax=Wenjunlia tyrosinilytica TaxID=1544741 RepID=UPI00166EA1AE|nr:(2Fe-2S)-binding protein [Wenjunlia tyrosinilytica]